MLKLKILNYFYFIIYYIFRVEMEYIHVVNNLDRGIPDRLECIFYSKNLISFHTLALQQSYTFQNLEKNGPFRLIKSL